jgi:hypothetical protein
MAKCTRCGKNAGFLSNILGKGICDDCSQAIIIEQKAEQSRRFDEYNAYKSDIISANVLLLQQKIESGEKGFIYESIYLPVDSTVMKETITEEFSIGPLRRLGFEGWDIVAVIPKTLGVALTNSAWGSTSGDTWGAGLGGNVVGVHIVIKKELSVHSNISVGFLTEYVERNLFDLITEEESKALRKLLP